MLHRIKLVAILVGLAGLSQGNGTMIANDVSGDDAVVVSSPKPSRPIVIAHRGASGYLPEHTLEAKSMAHAQRADFIEQDVVLTKDDIPVVLHDTHLDTVTDVASKYPDRKRQDGRFYVIDFTLAEIKTLNVTERIHLKTGKGVYPNRFPVGKGAFRVPTLSEEIELIQGLNQSTGREVGIYVELKAPAWHRREGKEISPIVLNVLDAYGYRSRKDAIYLQCFEAEECQHIRNELKSDLKLVLLLGNVKWGEENPARQQELIVAELQKVRQYADGIGPSLGLVVTGRDPQGGWKFTPLVAEAHRLGLVVHPYTFRKDELPKHFATFDEAMQAIMIDAQADGLFSDFPDLAVQFLNRRIP